MPSMITTVVLSRQIRRDLKQVPTHVAVKLQDWVEDVEERGLLEVRKIPGYHDEPLHGRLLGLRSIRLNRSYRAYYRVVSGKVEFVSLEGVNKHEY